jgi:hypothetical protein
MPTPIDAAFLRRAYSDDNGRLLLGGEPTILIAKIGKQPVAADSMPIVRTDFAARRYDTVAYVARQLVAANGTSRC